MKATVENRQIKFDFENYNEQLTFVRALNMAFTYCCSEHDSKCETCPLSKVVDEIGTDLCTNVNNMLFIRS
jgi:hypothetical protein